MGDFESTKKLLSGLVANPTSEHFDNCKLAGCADCEVIRDARRTPAERKALYEKQLSRAGGKQGREMSGATLLATLQSRCGVPPVVILALAGKLDIMARPFTAAQAYINQPTTHALLLMGSFGCGKSVAAAHVLRHYAKRFEWNGQSTGMSVSPYVWVDARELASIADWKESDRARFDALKAARVLVLDDIGDEGTNSGRDALANLMLHRYSQTKRTVITSNLTFKAFGARYGEALLDRLRSSSVAPNLAAEKSRRHHTEAA